MAIEKHKIIFSRQLELLWPCILTSVFAIVVYVFVIGLSAPIYIAIGFLSFFFIVNLLPVLILHVQYLGVNNNSILILSIPDKKLVYQGKGKHIDADFSEIESLQYYGSYGRNSWYTFGEYEFCKILLSNKKEIIITSLMMKEVKTSLEKTFSLKAENYFKLLALLPKNKNI